MFAFHKPRVYRSAEGCCICRAKSSSSRFTDSQRYENDSMKCFDLKYPRHGEICNACVLLVKRYKRLPIGSKRHWGHVVDARAGPKSLIKFKKYREDNERSNNTSSTSRHSAQSSKSIISEKFSKIFKKNKKNKIATKKESSTVGVKRKTTSAHSWDAHPSLPTTPESLDSDYEDSRISATTASGSVVQFQTQTRASSYRSRNTTANAALGNASRVKSAVVLVGSKRRKSVPPRRNRPTNTENVQFFDDTEWQQRNSCCGIVLECAKLAGALMIDLAHYKPCALHQKKIAVEAPHKLTVQPVHKTIIATSPAIVQLAPSTISTASLTNVNPTPVLKKHHLYFKRQSESFPHGDVLPNGNNTNLLVKTELSTLNTTVQQQQTATTTNFNTASNVNTLNAQPIYTTNISTHMPRHSTAKIATITSNVNVNSANTNASLNKSQNFLHKIKSDTGKIVKHSLEKLNAAVRIRPHELQDMKHVIKTVDKSFVLAKPTTVGANHLSSHQQSHNYHHPALIGASLTCASATSSAGSSPNSATKFSDNSSDSGFDENMLERKSVSPLQEDTERRMMTLLPGVQTMFLCSGAQVQGQAQSLLLAGNEATTKIVQNRKQQQQAVIASLQQQQQNLNRANVTNATASVKLTHIVGSGPHAKMRAIYNNNAIQHENGVTTIVPASSLAASTQTAAMNAMAPSTVTITPAPIHLNGPSAAVASTSSIALTTLNGKKMTAANLIGLANNININSSSSSSNIIRSNITNSNNNQSNINSIGNVGTTPLLLNNAISSNNTNNSNNNNVSSLNQKIILLKSATTKYSSNIATSNATIATTNIMPINQQTMTTSSLNHTTNTCKN